LVIFFRKVAGDCVKITRVYEIGGFQNPHAVEAKRLYDTDNAEAIHMALKPGQSLKKHITPVDVFFYVLEGKGIVEIGDEKQEVEKDMLIESPKLASSASQHWTRHLQVSSSESA